MSNPRMAAATRPPPVPSAPPDSQAATDAIKRRYEDTVEQARRQEARRHIQAAEAALQSEDVLAAANSYRLALRFTDDPEVQRTYEELNQRAHQIMVEAYLKQAKYEEGAGRHREAAISYAKAFDGRPEDPDIAWRAAEMLRKEGRDLHRAARFGEIAVQKSPTKAEFRVTLGHVYLDAGLVLRARSELEQAVRLAPTNAKAKELLAQARRMAS